jgi:hypothetical protein
MGRGERLAGDDLIPMPGLGITAPANVERIQVRLGSFRNRHDAPRGRFFQPGDVQRHLSHDPGFDRVHTGYTADAVRQRFRSALQLNEHVGEAIILVV